MNLGRPFTRPLLLHFSEGDAVRKVIDEFMLGENVLMAPVFADG
jgi:alpha-glucosidase (family GH31 glycosyl hydrolase)